MNREQALDFLIGWEERLNDDFKRDINQAEVSVSYYDFKLLIWVLTLVLKDDRN